MSIDDSIRVERVNKRHSGWSEVWNHNLILGRFPVAFRPGGRDFSSAIETERELCGAFGLRDSSRVCYASG
jgi:hypothetical protein